MAVPVVRAFENARKNLHLVAFLALADELRSAGAAAIDVALQVGFAQFEPRRTAIDDAAERRPVAFAKGGDREQSADRVSRHISFISLAATNCSRVSRNTPPPPRSKSSQVNGIADMRARSSALGVADLDHQQPPRPQVTCAPRAG